MRFLPTSSAMSAEYSINRSLMRSPARLTIATRSRHGTAAQAGCAARAAATASSTSAAVPRANVPSRMSRSIGERASKVPSPSRHSPSMKLR